MRIMPPSMGGAAGPLNAVEPEVLDDELSAEAVLLAVLVEVDD